MTHTKSNVYICAPKWNVRSSHPRKWVELSPECRGSPHHHGGRAQDETFVLTLPQAAKLIEDLRTALYGDAAEP